MKALLQTDLFERLDAWREGAPLRVVTLRRDVHGYSLTLGEYARAGGEHVTLAFTTWSFPCAEVADDSVTAAIASVDANRTERREAAMRALETLTGAQ